MTAQSAPHASDSVRASEAFSVPSLAALTHSALKPFAQPDFCSKSSLFLGILVLGLLLFHRGTAAAEDASSLTRHAVDALSQKRYDTALQAALAADAILEKDTMSNPRERVTTKLLIGEALLGQSRPIEAERLARESKAILDTSPASGLDGMHKVVRCYNLLARSLAGQGKHPEVLALASEVAAGVKSKQAILYRIDAETDGISGVLVEGISSAERLNDFPSAIEFRKLSIDLQTWSIKNGPGDEMLRNLRTKVLLQIKILLGFQLFNNAQYTDAVSNFASVATEATQHGFGDLANFGLVGLGSALVQDAQFEEGICVLSDAVARCDDSSREKALGLGFLFVAYQALEMFDDAKKIGETLLITSLKTDSLKGAAEALMKQASALLDTGNAVQAVDCLEFALKVLEACNGTEQSRFSTLVGLVRAYSLLLDSRKASHALGQAWATLSLATSKSTLIESNLMVAAMCGIESFFWSNAGKKAEQLSMALKSYSIYREFAAMDPISSARSALCLAWAYLAAGDYNSTMRFALEAQDNVHKQRNPNFNQRIECLDLLATVASKQGARAKAIGYRVELLDLAATKFGKNDPHYWQNLQMLGEELTQTGSFERASAVCVESQLLMNEHAWREMVFMPIGQGSGFSGFTLAPELACVSGLSSTNTSTHRAAAYASILAKGLHTEVCSVRAQMSSRSSVVATKRALQQFWSQAVGSNSFPLGVTAYSQKDKLGAEVLAALKDSRIPFAAVERAIPPASVLVDFKTFSPFGPNTPGSSLGTEHYAGILTFPPSKGIDASIVRIVDLGESGLINATIGELHQLFSERLIAPKRLEPVLQRLSALLYAPLASHLTNVAHLILCPDSQLGRLPFELLPVNGKGRFLVEDKLITYVNSGREVARLAQPRPIVPMSAPLVMGNPDFNLDFARSSRPEDDPSKLASRSSEPGTNGQSFFTTAAPNRMRSQDISSRGLKFNPLAGSEREARSVATLLGRDAIVRLGAAARESELKAVVSPSVLHLATHGFFLTDQEFKRTNSFREPWQLGGEFTPYPRASEQDWENPLIRCGIALAGANHASSITNALAEDGLLTGLEASLLNLQGTKLVILSACDTGSGDVKIGEGVMSLRRAFSIAGAETVLASHWKVNDEATSLLMTEFMRRWQAGEPRGVAWREAQLSLLRSKDFSNPYFWAAFTLTGQWR